MHVVSHFWLVYVTCTRLLCISKHLVRHLPDRIHTTQDLQFNKLFKTSKRNTNADYYHHHHHCPCPLINHYPIAIFDCPLSIIQYEIITEDNCSPRFDTLTSPLHCASLVTLFTFCLDHTGPLLHFPPFLHCIAHLHYSSLKSHKPK